MITRRDFLNGLAVTVATTAVFPRTLLAEGIAAAYPGQALRNYYPPVLSGIRGNHDGAYEVAHNLAWRGERPVACDKLDGHYDLVIVGGGISGLAAA